MSLLDDHLHIARYVARDYYLPGGDRDDVEQEAMIALWLAARAWNGSRPFEGFARMVIRRRLATAIDLANAQRHRYLNEPLREVPSESGERLQVLDVVPGGRDPADVLIERERLAAIVAAVESLSDVEREVLERIVNGEPYSTLTRTRESKRMENAADRMRRKLRAAA